MNTILVPTDFSAVAKKATDFAVSLAKTLDLKIKLVHAYQIETAFTYEAASVIEAQVEEVREESDKQLAAQKAQLFAEQGIEVETFGAYGPIVDVMLELADEQKEAVFVVMGTRGRHSTMERLWGSNAYHVSFNSTWPVFVIPETTDLHDLKHVVYAADFKKDEVVVAKKVIDLAHLLKAQPELLHVHTLYEPYLSNDREVSKHLEEEFSEEGLVSKLYLAEGIEEGIERFVEQHKPDLLVLAMKERGFLERMLHHSVTKHFIQTLNIPMLILPAKEVFNA